MGGCLDKDPKEPYVQNDRQRLTPTPADFGRLQNHGMNMERQLKECLNENEQLKARLRREDESSKQRIDKEEQEKNGYRREVDKLKQRVDEIEKEKTSLRRTIQNLEQENDHLKTRLSAIIGARLTDGNPDIADLSDINRPTNLSNHYSELYDNQWTDAFGELQEKEGMGDRDICILLCKIFCEIYKLCRQKADEDLERLRHVLKTFYGAENKELRKQFKDKRKAMYKHGQDGMKGVIEKAMVKLIQKDSMRKYEKLKLFIDESLNISWLMAVQDPPVFVDTDITREGDRFDTNVFKSYTATGALIDFVVWPAVYLVKGGSLLGKGVAQGRKTESEMKKKDTTTVQKHSAQTHNEQTDINQITINLDRSIAQNSTRQIKAQNIQNKHNGQKIPDQGKGQKMSDQIEGQNVPDKSKGQNIPDQRKEQSTHVKYNITQSQQQKLNNSAHDVRQSQKHDEQNAQKQTQSDTSKTKSYAVKIKLKEWQPNVQSEQDQQKTDLQTSSMKPETVAEQGKRYTTNIVIESQRL